MGVQKLLLGLNTQLREGDIFVVTAGIIYLGPDSTIPVSSFMYAGIINQNYPFENNTGLSKFSGVEAQVSLPDNFSGFPEGTGVRLDTGNNGQVIISLIFPKE